MRVSLWIFGLLLFLRTVISVNSIVNTHAIVTGADGIPVDSYPADAAQTILSLFAINALAQLFLTLTGIAVLAWYRRAIPFMFAMYLGEWLLRRAVFAMHPIARAGASPANVVNVVLVSLMVAGLLSSLRRASARSGVCTLPAPPYESSDSSATPPSAG